MPIPSSINELSTTPASNYPSGTDAPSVLDDVQRVHASFIAELRDKAIPTGTLLDFAGTSAPTNFLLCDGGSYSTAAYAALFAAIGYAWGGSGGSFNVPDLRRRTTIGSGGTALAGPVNTVGATGGLESVLASGLPQHTHGVNILSQNENNLHAHIATDSGHTHSGFVGTSAGTGYGVAQPGGVIVGSVGSGNAIITLGTETAFHQHQVFGNTDSGTGAGASMGLFQPSAVVTKIIKT